ncbi:unnamed protein product, partial [Staurois parvus]
LGHSGSQIHGKSQRCWLDHVISCVQSQLIACKQQNAISLLTSCYADSSVAPAVPPVSVHQCQLSVLIHATCQCPSVPHQCHISVPTSAHQCHISVPI